MFSLGGPKPIPLMVEAVRTFAGRYPEAEIVVWTFGTEKDAEITSALCFPELAVKCLRKDYAGTEAGDIVVDDDNTYWDEIEDIMFFYPDDFVRAVRADNIQVGE